MARKTSKYAMTPVSTAQNTILTSLSPVATETVPLHAVLGRILRSSVHAAADVPAFAASIKDGYAVSQSTPTDARTGPLIVRDDLASHASASDGTAAAPLRPSETAYVATGAMLPPGADAVAMIEDVLPSADGSAVTLRVWPASGTDVRFAGADVRKGEEILPSGCILGAAEIGLLAMCGVTEVEVTRLVRVGVMSSGDELCAEGGVLKEGAVHDANRPMLLALIKQHLPCAIGIDLGVVRDGRLATEDAVERALQEVDVLVTSGGVSMGEKDFLKPVLEEKATVRFGRVNMKPGKPLTFATSAEKWCAVALPGNPVSAFVCFLLAACPAVKTLAGYDGEHARGRIVEAVLSHDFALDKYRPEFHRATLKVR